MVRSIMSLINSLECKHMIVVVGGMHATGSRDERGVRCNLLCMHSKKQWAVHDRLLPAVPSCKSLPEFVTAS